MRFRDEYRHPEVARKLADRLAARVTRPWTLMEVCGGQTHAIVRYGVDQLLPEGVELLHGPGCPVCVTPLEAIDRAHAIAARPEVIFCSFGDMLRVPGSDGDLLSRKAQGADVRVVYSPMDALALAEKHPDREVVFFAIGFETTAPANGTAVWAAARKGVENFSALVSHVLVPPALTAILEAPGNRVQAFLGPGHVCAVMGLDEYRPIAARHAVPIVVTGFEPVDLLEGILRCVTQLEEGRAEVENQYSRVVQAEGNPRARALVEEVFEVCDRPWRGVGPIPRSGLRLAPAYQAYDAARRFQVEAVETREPEACISGEVLRGLARPDECSAFGQGCTPDHPLGATMVSNEGACAAYFQHRRAGRRAV